jgi:hypothetical protein
MLHAWKHSFAILTNFLVMWPHWLGDSNEAKDIIFQTFHLTHKRDFKRIRGNHLAASLDDIITFMEDAYDGYEQEKVLQTTKQNGSQLPHQDTRSNKKQRTSGHDGGTNRSKERCVMHNGAHMFALNCPSNKALSIYDPDHMTKCHNSQSAAHRGGRGIQFSLAILFGNSVQQAIDARKGIHLGRVKSNFNDLVFPNQSGNSV